MPRRRHALAPPALALVLALAGCGTSRPYVPDLLKVTSPYRFRTLDYPRAGVALTAPRDWIVAPQRAPLVMVASSGPATIALWRYRAATPEPVGSVGLGAARAALLGAARARQPKLQLIRSAIVEVDGHGAVELDTIQTLNGQLRRVRSMHVYLPGGELVLEEYAPPSLFHSVDHTVFSPVKRSLRLLTARTA